LLRHSSQFIFFHGQNAQPMRWASNRETSEA